MAKAEGIPPTASVASLGFGIQYIGNHIYGASGEINTNNNVLTALEFTSGSGYILAFIYWGVDITDFDTDKNVGLEIKLNDLLFYQTRGQLSASGDWDGIVGNIKVEFLIPPFTPVKIEVSTNQANTVGQTILISGRVYDA